jgi:hypothetical protein
MNLGDGDSSDIYQTAIDTGTITPDATSSPSAAQPTPQPQNTTSGFNISSLLNPLVSGVQQYEQATFITQWIQYGVIGLIAYALIKSMNKGRQ